MKKLSFNRTFRYLRSKCAGCNEIVCQVTWKHMKMNKKRTWTTFLGIFFMILLMTCVFVGRETATAYLQEVGAQEKGKWHASMYDISGKEMEEVRKLSYVQETARSADYGYTDFEAAGNSLRPYLYIKAYEPACFDWMNIKLAQGRFPEKDGEIVLSKSAMDDGAAIAVGDRIKARYFDREITGIAEEGSTTFPFFDMTVSYGETLDVPQDFPYYDENDSFRIDRYYKGEEQELTVVGIVETPWFEEDSAAGYLAFTVFNEEKSSTYHLSLMMDLKAVPGGMYQELRDIAGDRKVEFNNKVLAFSGDSSDSVVNFMVRVMTIFFMIVIMIAAIILIYNVFNISFEERSRYLGMLCSVGATGRQKRSSVYFEAFSLFVPALPLGFLAGCLVVWVGMSLFQPFIYAMLSISRELIWRVPIHLQLSWKAFLVIAAVSAWTVFLSAILPAKKISKIGPIECIRGNLEKENGKKRRSFKYSLRLSAEKLLAKNSLGYQKRKTKGMGRAAAAFMVILIITIAGSQMVTKLVSYRMLDRDTIKTRDEGWDYRLFMLGNRQEEQETLKEEICNDPGVEAVREQYLGMFAGSIPQEALSREYWNAVHRIFNLYYHRELSDKEFEEIFDRGAFMLNLIAVERDVFEEIAEAADTDMELLKQKDKPCAIVVQSGEVSTENWGVGGMEPEKYEFHEVEKMTDLEMGEELPMSLYSPDQEKNVSFPLQIAGYGTNEQLKDYFTFHSESMWAIVDLETGEQINDILRSHKEPDADCYTMDRILLLKMNKEETELLSRLTNLAESMESDYMFVPAQYAKTVADAINSIIRILLLGFVLLTSVICLLNLYNSIHGWISGQKRHFAMMISLGMTQKQIEKMLLYEAGYLLIRSSIRAVLISAVLLLGLRECLCSQFGHVNFPFPWWIFAGAILLTAIVIFAFMLYHYRREKNYDFRAVLMV